MLPGIAGPTFFPAQARRIICLYSDNSPVIRQAAPQTEAGSSMRERLDTHTWGIAVM